MATRTIAQQLNGERLVVLAWPRAILLQFAHPLVATGVAAHSSFTGGALSAASRLHHTVRAMRALTFGGPDRREAAIARIRRIHARIHGTLPAAAGPFPAGTRYSAEDPALLLWVHATLLESIPLLHEQVVGPLAPADRDAWCAESAPTLIALGGEPAAAPITWSGLCRYMDAVRSSGILVVTPTARTLARKLLSPTAAGLPVPLAGLSRTITLGLLPPAIRDAYGFRWGAADARRFTRALAWLRAVRAVTPAALCRWRD